MALESGGGGLGRQRWRGEAGSSLGRGQQREGAPLGMAAAAGEVAARRRPRKAGETPKIYIHNYISDNNNVYISSSFELSGQPTILLDEICVYAW